MNVPNPYMKTRHPDKTRMNEKMGKAQKTAHSIYKWSKWDELFSGLCTSQLKVYCARVSTSTQDMPTRARTTEKFVHGAHLQFTEQLCKFYLFLPQSCGHWYFFDAPMEWKVCWSISDMLTAFQPFPRQKMTCPPVANLPRSCEAWRRLCTALCLPPQEHTVHKQTVMLMRTRCVVWLTFLPC